MLLPWKGTFCCFLKNNNNKGIQQSFGGDGYVYYLDWVMVTPAYTYIQTHQIVYISYVQFFIYQIYLNKDRMWVRKDVCWENQNSNQLGMEWTVFSSFIVPNSVQLSSADMNTFSLKRPLWNFNEAQMAPEESAHWYSLSRDCLGKKNLEIRCSGERICFFCNYFVIALWVSCILQNLA